MSMRKKQGTVEYISRIMPHLDSFPMSRLQTAPYTTGAGMYPKKL